MVIFPFLEADDDVAIELDRSGDTITLHVEAACLQSSDLAGDDYYYGNVAVQFNGQSAATSIDYSLDQSAMFLNLPPTTLTPGVVATGSLEANYDPNFNFNVILFDTGTTYVGTSGADYIFGSDFADRLSGGAGDDGIEAGAGDDWLNGGAGADVLDGGAGNDTASYAGASTGVLASLTDPSINTGDAKGDTYISIENLEGSSYGDHLYGDSGSNVLTGGNGDDWLNGGSGGDVYDGGEGIDTASYVSAAGAVVASLSDPSMNAGYAKGDTYVSIEDLSGSNFNDRLFGDSGANLLRGNAGDDVLSGLGGDDILIGGPGADMLNGGDGIDTASYTTSAEGVVASLATRSGSAGDAAGDRYTSIENLVGSAFDDTLIGDAGANTLNGGAGDDVLMGGPGADRLDGGVGQDTADYSDATAAVRVSLENPSINTGDAAGDTFVSIENLTGSNHGGQLVGDAQANVIVGGSGDDVIAGRGGDDRLSGGGGYNTFVFDVTLELNGDVAHLVDYNVASDRIRLAPSVFTALTPGLTLDPAEFHVGASATTADQHILYNPQSGSISYDPDGSGAKAAIAFALVPQFTAMTSNEFAVV